MNGPAEYEGGCLCAAVRGRATEKPMRVAHCHCRMCRRNSGAAFATCAVFRFDAVTWTRGSPTFYQSSENAKRGFCSRCGSWLSWHYLEDRMAFNIGSFDNSEQAPPDLHIMTESQLP